MNLMFVISRLPMSDKLVQLKVLS